jgi:hypothetical protein
VLRVDCHLISRRGDEQGEPVPPYHAWREGTDQTLCGHKPIADWYIARDRWFPPEDGAACPVCLSHVNAVAHPDRAR